MIIKSLSRKHPSFAQLYEYITSKSRHHGLTWNLPVPDPDDEAEVVSHFQQNAAYLHQLHNGNFLFHEIVSIKDTGHLDRLTLIDALEELTQHYLEQRAPNLIAYGRIHQEEGNVHYHLMISSNEVGERSRYRLSKFDFLRIQQDCERYLFDRFPQLPRLQLYARGCSTTPSGPSEREYQRERRLQSDSGRQHRPLSDKARVMAQLMAIFEEDITHLTPPLEQRLATAGFALYISPKGHPGVIKGKKKYRLYRMGLVETYHRVLAREKAIARRKAELSAHAQRTAPVHRLMEREEDFSPDAFS